MVAGKVSIANIVITIRCDSADTSYKKETNRESLDCQAPMDSFLTCSGIQCLTPS